MIKILSYTPQNKGSLLATFSISIPKWAGLQIHDLCLWSKNNHRWVTFPCKTIRDPDNPDKKTYAPYLIFPDSELQKRFQEKVLDEIDAYLKQAQNASGKITQFDAYLFPEGCPS